MPCGEDQVGEDWGMSGKGAQDPDRTKGRDSRGKDLGDLDAEAPNSVQESGVRVEFNAVSFVKWGQIPAVPR